MTQRREQYLDALGIDLWVRRSRPDAPLPAAVPMLPQASAAPSAPPAPSAPLAPPAVAAALPARSPLPAFAAPPADDSWERLRAEVSGCTKCGLAAGRTQTVFGVGDTAARWLVIGEAPGEQEDLRGEPFVGAAGQLLDKMLLAIDLPRASVFIANILKCRPPGNRDPRPEEVGCCLPYLARQIALLRPALILCVGRIAAQTLLATDTPIGRLRGQVHRFGPLQTPLVVTYHPSYLLRSPGEKRKAWEDLKFARRTFEELTAPGAAR
jgi:DNA polymerase